MIIFSSSRFFLGILAGYSVRNQAFFTLSLCYFVDMIPVCVPCMLRSMSLQ